MSGGKKLAFGAGIIFNVLAVYLLLLFVNLISHNVDVEGAHCPGPAQCEPPGINESGMGIYYPPVIKLNSSEPIEIKTVIYQPEPERLGCSQQNPITISYEANLWTSGFDLSPSSPQTASDSIKGRVRDSTADWVWIAHPKEPGTYSLHAEVLTKTENCTVSRLSKTFEIRVVNLFGLNATQVQMVSMLGFILGTTLTVPGLIALWIQYQDRKAAKVAKEKARAAEEAEAKKNKKTVKLIISSSGQEKEIEVDDPTKD